MRKLGLMTIAVAVLTLSGSAVRAEDALPAASWLFIQEAEFARYADNELVLSGVDRDVIAFTDRPHRIATHIDLPAFAGLWAAGQDSFDGERPNAGITMSSMDGTRTAVVELGLPHVSGQALVYPIMVLTGVLPAQGMGVSLFIDAFPTALNSQITAAITDADSGTIGYSGTLYEATSQALGNAAHNATTSQQQTNVADQAGDTQGVSVLYGLDTADEGKATRAILDSSFGDGR